MRRYATAVALAELPWQQGQAATAAPGAQAGAYPENGYYFVAFNTREGRPFADQRLREALARAVDLPALVRDVTGGQGQPIASAIAPGSWADTLPPPTSTLDLERAGTLLRRRGRLGSCRTAKAIRQQNGITLTVQLFVRGDDPRRVRAAELIAAAGKQVGIEIGVQPADFASVIRSKYAPPYDFDLLLGSWSNGAADSDFADDMAHDPDDFALFHRSQINQGVADTRPVLNIGGFADAVYDNQAGAAHQLYDPAERLRLSSSLSSALPRPGPTCSCGPTASRWCCARASPRLKAR